MSASASERDVWNWAHPRSSTNSRWSLRSVSNEVSENENCELLQQRGGGWRMAAARLATASRLPRATIVTQHREAHDDGELALCDVAQVTERTSMLAVVLAYCA